MKISLEQVNTVLENQSFEDLGVLVRDILFDLYGEEVGDNPDDDVLNLDKEFTVETVERVARSLSDIVGLLKTQVFDEFPTRTPGPLTYEEVRGVVLANIEVAARRGELAPLTPEEEANLANLYREAGLPVPDFHDSGATAKRLAKSTIPPGQPSMVAAALEYAKQQEEEK